MLVSTTDTRPVLRPIDAIGQDAADVAAVSWPSDHVARSRARIAGRPCLLVVDPTVAPPTDCGTHEDWVLTTTPRADVRARLRSLAARPAPAHPAPFDPALAADLDDRQVVVLAALDVRPGHPTRRSTLAAVVDDERELASLLRSLRRTLRPSGIELVELPGDGDVLLARVHAVADGSPEPRSR